MAYLADTGRSQDVIELEKLARYERDPERRKLIHRTIQIISNESGAIRSMREALIKAHRSGDVFEVKDIHDFVKNKEKYQNERF
jgi:hypothetical protein